MNRKLILMLLLGFNINVMAQENPMDGTSLGVVQQIDSTQIVTENNINNVGVGSLNSALNTQKSQNNNSLVQEEGSVAQVEQNLPTETIAVVERQNEYVDEVAVQKKYKKALTTHNRRNYKQAVIMMTELLNEYPTSVLAGNFQYWIGEALFLEKDYAGAIDAFSKVFNYEKCYKHDDAQYMLGKVNLHKGDDKQAMLELETLMIKYPNSEYVPKANNLMARIK